MSTGKHIDKICMAAVAVTLVLTILLMCGGTIGIAAVSKTVKYASTLFDTSYVHTIDIVMNDWDSFIQNCESEDYSLCTVVVDGAKHANTAIRAKGNTSLSSVKASGSQRYSFKLEFDHYQEANSLDGLDKLCLNNLIQDNTMMKDYIVYQLMNDFGVDSPLCSFAYLTVNGEDWGLYLAVEGIEDSFLSRTYGSDAGDLYKPDSMSFGGGRGNGKNFNMDDVDLGDGDDENDEKKEQKDQNTSRQDGFTNGGQFPGQGGFNPGGFDPGNFNSGDFNPGGVMPGGQFPGQQDGTSSDAQIGDGEKGEDGKTGIGKMFGGMGSDDVKLKYIDDDPSRYSNIFKNAKTDISTADKNRLIASLKKLSSYTDLENVLDTDEVLRYFVVHNFVCNGDSYTGSMIHNYYLHESDGKLSMIPWDYNLAFGTFMGGDASGTVNSSIDNPVSRGNADDRPMVGWIFSDESCTEAYHKLFSSFMEKWFSDGQLEKLIADTAAMLRPYVEKDPTKFCTVEDFDKGVEALTQFVSLRGEAVSRQLAGDDTAVETGSLTLSDMGSMGGGMGKNPAGQFNWLSMLTLTDKDGKEVDVSTVLGDTSSIVSLQLSDGTKIELSSNDMKKVMQTDFSIFSKVIAAETKEGKVIDLSAYTVSVKTDTTKTTGKTRKEKGRKEERKKEGEKNDSASDDAQPSSDETSQGKRQFARDDFSGKSFSGQGGDGKTASFPSGGSFTPPDGTGGNHTEENFWMLLLFSGIVLGAGLFVAVRKKV